MGKSYSIRHLGYQMTFVYLFLSVFEFYINATIGNVCRYFMLFFCGLYVVEFFISGKYKEITYRQLSIFLWLLYSCISIFWSTNLNQVKVYIFTFVTMALLWFCSLSIELTKKQIDKLLSFYQICSMILCLLGVFFSAPLLEDNTNNIRYVLYIGGHRADPNYLLALYVISVQIGLYHLLYTTKNKIFNYVAIVLGIVVILYTGSRSGIVIIAISFLVLGYERLSQLSILKKIGLIVLFMLMLGVLYLIASRFIPTATLNRVFGVGDIKFSDGTGRLESWRKHFSTWSGFSNKIFGMGFGSNTAHGTIVTFIIEFGLIGFSLYLYPVLSIFTKNFKKKNVLALALMLGGLFQAFMCPATNMRFFWNAMIIPSLIMHCNFRDNKDMLSISKENKTDV